MDEDTEAIVAYLKSLPEGFVVRWGTDHLWRGFASAWIDITLVDAGLGSNWDFTIVSAHDDLEPGDPPPPEWEFVVEQDLHVFEVSDPKTFDSLGLWFGPKTEAPPYEVSAHLDELAGTHGTEVAIYPAWSPQQIENALYQWAGWWADRDDLLFLQVDYRSKMLEKAEMARAAIQNGTAATYQIGEKLRVSDRVMDFLLENPDAAPEITAFFENLGREIDPS